MTESKAAKNAKKLLEVDRGSFKATQLKSGGIDKTAAIHSMRKDFSGLQKLQNFDNNQKKLLDRAEKAFNAFISSL